ncbi:hypothetical protein [Rhabdaerophilum calidifontis]|uniref:hypothetical protein n=1 Tax=Rhabdaerophilum calidifontis TaxID=2604328 RepID=UPI00123AA054|nr:hypothetical protein [Rhabdaerophilum calidifontis]
MAPARFRGTPMRRAAALAAAMLAGAGLSAKGADTRVGPANDPGSRERHAGQGALPLLAAAMPQCTCRAGGVSHALGAEICLGTRLFRCAMDLNVTSWQATGSLCPES